MAHAQLVCQSQHSEYSRQGVRYPRQTAVLSHASLTDALCIASVTTFYAARLSAIGFSGHQGAIVLHFGQQHPAKGHRSMTTGALLAPLETNSAAPAIPPTAQPYEHESDQRIRSQVQQLLQLFHHRSLVTDRRFDRREPFPYPIHITPIAADGSPELNETIIVLGKHLSERGLDFYYQAPVPHRRVIASWECADGHWLAMILDLRWCRSNRYGWYENGGRFLQVVNSPFADLTESTTTAGTDAVSRN